MSIIAPMGQTRLAYATPGIWLAILTAVFTVGASAAVRAFLICLAVAIGALGAVRAARIGVKIQARHVIVRGMLRSHTLIREVTNPKMTLSGTWGSAR